MTGGEEQLARGVFGNSIIYSEVEIIHGNWMFGLPPENRAMAPNGNIYFDENNPDYSSDFSQSSTIQQGLFLHEMTHVWQHQSGESVIGRGMFERTYTYEVKCGSDLLDYNLEQQGQIVMDAFYRRNGVRTRAYGSQSYQDISMGFYEATLMNLSQFPEYQAVSNEGIWDDDDF